MSVKSKVKRSNKRIIELEQEIDKLRIALSNKTTENSNEKQLYENIIKFAITNHVGGLHAGMMIDYFGVDKMKDLRLDIGNNHFEHAYIIRVGY